MPWALFAITAAVSWATADMLSKIAMTRRGYSERVTLFARFIHSLPFLLIPLIVSNHQIDRRFWLYCLAVIPGDILASAMYIKALKISPISVVVPLMSFAPVFMLITSTLMLGEPPSTTGLIGVLLVTAGAYTLNLDRSSQGILAPLKAILTEKGPLMVIGAAAIFSIDTALGKEATKLSDPIFFSFFYSLFMSIGYAPFLSKEKNRAVLFKAPILYGVGGCFALGVVSFLYAIKEANIAYVSATGKISMLVAILYGRFIFHEERTGQRMAGALLMLLGVYLIFSSG